MNNKPSVSIPLHGKSGNGKFAIIDEEDFERVSKFKWYILKSRGYAVAYQPSGKHLVRNKTIFMHRFILGCPEGLSVDHINHDSLDNRRSNLRAATVKQNQYNRRWKPHSSVYRGIIFRPTASSKNPWVAHIKHDGVRYYLGTFDTEVHAAMAFDLAARDLWGEYANLNFPNGIHGGSNA